MKMNWNFDLLIDYYSPEIISHISQYLTPISKNTFLWKFSIESTKNYIWREKILLRIQNFVPLFTTFQRFYRTSVQLGGEKKKKKDKRNSIQRTKARSIEFYVWIKLSKGVFQGPREIQSTRPPLLKRSLLLKTIRKALRIAATSGRHFNARALPRRGLKAPSKENIRVACHPRMSTRALPDTRLKHRCRQHLHATPSSTRPRPLLLGLTALFSACLLKMTEDVLEASENRNWNVPDRN